MIDFLNLIGDNTLIGLYTSLKAYNMPLAIPISCNIDKETLTAIKQLALINGITVGQLTADAIIDKHGRELAAIIQEMKSKRGKK